MILIWSQYYFYEHESPTRPKWAEKTLEVVGDLVGYPLDPRKTISQFHTASFASEVYLSEKCFMMVSYDIQSYQEASIDPIMKKTM